MGEYQGEECGMINSKKDLKEYLKADKEAFGISAKRPPLFGKETWKYEIILKI